MSYLFSVACSVTNYSIKAVSPTLLITVIILANLIVILNFQAVLSLVCLLVYSYSMSGGTYPFLKSHHVHGIAHLAVLSGPLAEHFFCTTPPIEVPGIKAFSSSALQKLNYHMN